jgi:coatomer subunit delta
MVLMTTKRSNTLQDIDTLHLFSQVVSNVRRNGLDEREITCNVFELLSAFDEIVSLGISIA